jgi:hypothetical protein
MLPPTPPTAPQNMSGGRIVIQLSLQCVFSIISETNIVVPMDKPPNKLARVPPKETPPFVPGGTDFSVVIRTGGWEERMPSSEARVSPRQQAKWLVEHNLQGNVQDAYHRRTELTPVPQISAPGLIHLILLHPTDTIHLRTIRSPLRSLAECKRRLDSMATCEAQRQYTIVHSQ